MKKYISGLITGFLLALSITAFAAVPGIKSAAFTDKVIIEVDGVKQNVEVISVVKEGKADARNYVSVGDLAPAMGGEVKWNGDKQTVEIKTVSTTNETKSSNNEEWIPFRDLQDKYGFYLGVGSGFVEIYEYYKSSNDNKLIVTIPFENNQTGIKIKIENGRTYINKADLIKKGIIKS